MVCFTYFCIPRWPLGAPFQSCLPFLANNDEALVLKLWPRTCVQLQLTYTMSMLLWVFDISAVCVKYVYIAPFNWEVENAIWRDSISVLFQGKRLNIDSICWNKKEGLKAPAESPHNRHNSKKNDPRHLKVCLVWKFRS